MFDMRSLVLGSAALALTTFAPVPAGAQRASERDRDREFQEAQSRIDTTFAFNRSGVVDLTQISGDVVVTTWDRAEARVRAYAERGRVRAGLSSSRLSLSIEPVRGRVGDSRFEVTVPVGVRVVARSRSGDVSVRGTKGPVQAESSSGDVEIADAADRVVLESISGDLRASQLNGEVRASSVSGTIEIREVTGDI